ncbi:MAG TPA: hypothetical protein VFZ16_09695 [Hyphomicrobiaceae bacterium]|nr:hypothetical protein [Hyphomicrobiaceae bacterium]
MAHIVPFKSATARGAEETEASPPEGAEIIIFPGVRRERHAEPETDAAATMDDGPMRDVLELPD